MLAGVAANGSVSSYSLFHSLALRPVPRCPRLSAPAGSLSVQTSTPEADVEARHV
jgi:hypothetical protein